MRYSLAALPVLFFTGSLAVTGSAIGAVLPDRNAVEQATKDSMQPPSHTRMAESGDVKEKKEKKKKKSRRGSYSGS